MQIIGCPVCLGKKQVMGLGAMMNKCAKCKGIGYIEKPEEIVASEAVASEVVDEVTSVSDEPVCNLIEQETITEVKPSVKKIDKRRKEHRNGAR